MPGIASAATSVLIGYIAGNTQRIRVGAGGIMLPNHAPLVVAEQFGTLESLYPGRIDLGLGRAPGSDQITSRALNRDTSRAEQFLKKSVNYKPYSALTMVAMRCERFLEKALMCRFGYWARVSFSAQLAAQRGLPYVFAGHFAHVFYDAIEIYRRDFKPSSA